MPEGPAAPAGRLFAARLRDRGLDDQGGERLTTSITTTGLAIRVRDRAGAVHRPQHDRDRR